MSYNRSEGCKGHCPSPRGDQREGQSVHWRIHSLTRFPKAAAFKLGSGSDDSVSLTRSTASIPPTNLTTNLSWWHLSTLRQYLQPVGSESIHHTAGKARYGPTNSAVGGSTNLLRKSAWERANCRACTGMGFGRIWNLVPKRMASLRPSRTDRDVLLLGPNSRSIIAPLLQLFQRRVLSNSCLLTLAWWVSFVSG